MTAYVCSQCHHRFTAEGDAEACPNCHAEAGLEPEHAVPLPMKLFGACVGVAIALWATGGVLGRVLG